MVAASAELIVANLVDRHRELCTQLSAGVVAVCSALWTIRAERTYRAQGCTSFGQFLERSGLSDATGRLYANAGPALLELEKTGDAGLVKHAELLKPIHLMIAKAVRDANDADVRRIAAKQATIVRMASAVARRGQEPLTASIVEDVAEKNFHWTPARKRKQQKAEVEVPPARFEHPSRNNVRQLIKNAELLLGGLNSETAVQYAAVHRLPGFYALADWFAEVVAEARRFDHMSPELWAQLEGTRST